MNRQEDHVGVPVFFRCRRDVYRGIARYYANWYHVYVLGRLWSTGGWGSVSDGRGMSDKFETREDQLVDLENGRSIQVEYLDVEPTTIEPGEYAPQGDGRTQGRLFEAGSPDAASPPSSGEG